MEFVLARGFDLGRVPVQEWSSAAITSLQGAPMIDVVGSTTVLQTGKSRGRPDGGRDLFDGYASIDGHFVHDLLDPGDHDVARLVDAVQAGREVDGGLFMASRLDARGCGDVHTDPIGQYPLFYLRSHRGFLVSNNVHFVEKAARASGMSLTRSISPAIDNSVIGGPLGGRTLFAEVRSLLPGQSVRIDDDGGLQVVDTYERQVREERGGSMRELVEDSVGSMRRHVDSVVHALPDAELVSDLTGGSDSRAVVALLSASDALERLSGRCITRYPHPDANVAGLLMEHMGICPGPYPFVAQPRVIGQMGIIRTASQLHGGARDAAIHFPFELSDFVHFTGSFGELGGATPGTDYMSAEDPLGSRPFTGPVESLLARRQRVGATAMLTGHAVEESLERFRAELAQLADAGVERGHVGAEMYLRNRSRAHFGLANFFGNKTLIRPDILASRRLVRLRRALPAELHQANKAMLEIILNANSELAFLPMVKKWDSSIVPTEWSDMWAAMRTVDSTTQNLSRFDGVLFESIPVRGFGAKRTGQPGQTGTRVPSRRAFAAAPAAVGNQAMLREVLDAVPPGHDIWHHYSRRAVEESVRREPGQFGTGMEVNALSRAAMGMIWALGWEEPMQITKRIGIKELTATHREAG